ncbi:c-type cytochrome [bacterium]|jgi:cytochrome c oxidase cbb3-type subunit III|nr:c-type cytochrome [bacterium]
MNEKKDSTQNHEDSSSSSLILEDEKDIVLDHDYDGIKELDNPLPKWWVNMFYLTAVFAVIYTGYYHFRNGNLIEDRFQKSMIVETKENSDSLSDIAAVGFSEENASIDEGASLYTSRCAACHGQKAEGIIGPNLTDNYWLNGDGSNDSIYNTIKVGIPEKGMIAWEALLKPSQISSLVLYIQSIKGTAPANGKPAQGTLFE